MKIAYGCDHGGYAYKKEIFEYLQKSGHQVVDFGTTSAQAADYASYAQDVANCVVAGKADFGILVCGTGIGMSIAANKIKGVRCAVLSDTFSAHATREHNDANIMALGARTVGLGLALDIINTFLNTPFSNEERHQRRINQIKELENK